MKKLRSVMLYDYNLDRENCEKGEAQSHNYPGHPPSFAVNIKIIAYEEKTALLRTLRPGDIIEFPINQEIEYTVHGYRGQERECTSHVKGQGGGEIVEVRSFDNTCDDDDYQEVMIVLKDGYAENL